MLDPLKDWLSQLDSYKTYLLGSERVDGGQSSKRAATNGGWFLDIHMLAVKQTVSELVSLCLDMGCYGNNLSPQGLAEFVCDYYPLLDMKRAWNVLIQQDWGVRMGVWKRLAECVSVGGWSVRICTSYLSYAMYVMCAWSYSMCVCTRLYSC